jgi:hypothetical protein
MTTLINAVAYQIGWFACVLGAAYQLPWIGTLVSLGVVALHLVITTRPHSEFMLIVAAALIGLVLDSSLASTGLVAFPSGVFIEGVSPHWMIALWVGFATTLNVSLRWLTRNRTYAIAFGAVGGPIAYLAGTKLGAMTIANPSIALPVIGASWAAAMFVLATLASRLPITVATQERIA